MQNPLFPDIIEGATAAQYVAKKWGIKTRLVPFQTFAVLTTVQLALKGNPKRFQLLVANLGSGNVFVGWDAGLTTSNGLLISASGGSLGLVIDEDAELVTYALYAIAPAAGSQLTMWEVESL
jgi:hypothetical protein